MSSCQNLSSAALGYVNRDSIETNDQEPVIPVRKPLLLDKWDSLQRNQILFVVDTVNKIDVKTQKKNLKDSLKREFDKKPKHVFLTFDDGPLVGSAAIDSLAKAKDIKVSVFLVGKHANSGKARKRDLARYESNPLIACYNHSYTHAHNRYTYFYSNPNTAFDDFEKNENDLSLKHKIVRLPGRNIWIYDDVRKIDLQSGSSTADLLFENGYKVYGWDVEWRINSLTGVPVQALETVFGKMKSFLNYKSSMTPNNVVLLMHDDMFQTKKGQELLGQLIDNLKKENYNFEFMQDYPIKY
ncbi:polysaccharide deacetylase family protein [Sphingobacterium sp. C459-1T]|uniref:Polysaccharide deacetylase family protein n=2 Tax=Sphingobacterium faecale TaxID=2803775 RepID=A0ABS1QZ00_9SPHI|nr:polysaccharide deacetylase family protein [Sphingobacterium faecale]